MGKSFIRKIEESIDYLDQNNLEDFVKKITKYPELLSDRELDTSLIHEASFRSDDCVKKVIKYGANINQIDTAGSTVLMTYSSKGELSMVEHLLLNGADPNIEEILGETALSWAVYEEHFEVAKLLIKYGAKTDHVISKNPVIFSIKNLAMQSLNEEIQSWGDTL